MCEIGNIGRVEQKVSKHSACISGQYRYESGFQFERRREAGKP